MAAERIRQQGYQRETDAVNATAQNRYTDFGDKQAKTGKKLGDYFAQDNGKPPAAPADGPTGDLPSSASNVITQETSKQLGKAKAYTDNQGAALGQLRAFGDVLGDTSRLQARDAGTIGQIGGFERGSSNVLPFELEAANSKGSGLKMLGDILGGVGSMATGYGLSHNVAGPAAAAASSASSATPTLSGITNSAVPAFARVNVPAPSLGQLFGGGVSAFQNSPYRVY